MLWTLWLASALAAPPKGHTQDLLFDEVVLGEAHGCGRRPDGTVACWGRNDRGQLGDGTFDDAAFPRPVQGVADVVALAAGSFHTCAVRRDRTVACWGDNQAGQLGAGTMEAQPKPVVVADLGPVLSLALGASHSCAVTTDRTVSCWGNNLHRQLGLADLRTVPRPVPVPGVPPMTDVAAGYGHTCATGADGPAWCWGDPTHGQLGRAVPADPAPQPPAPVDAELPSLRAIAARGNQTCALHAEGVHCWGAPPADATPRPAAEQVVRQAGLVALSVGWGHGCALSGGREVTCWGDDRFGQLGGLTPKDGVVVGAYGVRDAVFAAAGLGESCAARGRSGRTVCWGSWTREEVAAARSERREVEATPAARRRALPTGVELTLSMEEVLKPEGAVVRVEARSVQVHTCANTKLDNVVTHKGRKVIMELGDPFLPGGDCIATPGPAVASVDLPSDEIGRRDVVVRWKRREDFYQVYLRMNRLEVLPLAETFSSWEGAKALARIPPGSLAISCDDRLDQPMCQRRSRDDLPTCSQVLGHERIKQAPRLASRDDYANTWFTADPHALRISPDDHHEGYRTWFEDTWRDGSGCLDVRVRTWQGETWRNTHPAQR